MLDCCIMSSYFASGKSLRSRHSYVNLPWVIHTTKVPRSSPDDSVNIVVSGNMLLILFVVFRIRQTACGIVEAIFPVFNSSCIQCGEGIFLGRFNPNKGAF